MSLKTMLKSVLLKVAPRQAEALLSKRQHEHVRRFEERLGLPELQARYQKEHPLSVQRGPFSGMIYIAEATGSMFIPKLIGSYEAELAPIVHDAIVQQPRVVVDIGCAEGYYAVGMARALPAARIFAYDMDPHARTLCRQLAERNGVQDQVEIRIEASRAELNTILVPGAFVICDCEGCESFVLDPVACPALASCDILIELHEFLSKGTTARLEAAFSSSHTLTRLSQTLRDPHSYPELKGFTAEEQSKLVQEFRPPDQQWMLLKARTR